jgi:hypothetical protein
MSSEPRQFDSENLAIKEQQGGQRLVLGRGGHLLAGAHLCGVPLAMEEDVPLDPVDVRFLGAAAVVAGPDGFAGAVQEARSGGLRRTCLVKRGGVAAADGARNRRICCDGIIGAPPRRGS